MLNITIKDADNGYIISHYNAIGSCLKAEYVATDVHALGLLIKQLAGAERHRQCKDKKSK